LSITNIIENPNGAVRRVSGRVCRCRDADMETDRRLNLQLRAGHRQRPPSIVPT
jgi:hypothetical protein